MNTTKNTTRWIAGLAIAAGLGAAIAFGSAVASADPGTTSVGPIAEAPSNGTPDGQSERRRATFAGASVTEVKFDDMDANSKKPDSASK
jgi:hypothetical protein